MLKLKSFILLIYCFGLCFICAVKAEMSKPVSWAYQHGSCGNRIDVIDSTAEGACAQMATTILCPHPFIKPVYTSTGINPEPYSGRGTCKYSYIIPDAIMPGIVPPQIYKGSSGNIQVDGYVSRYFCPPQKMPTTRDEFLSMENTSRLLSELQECPKSCPVEPLADYKGSPGYDRFESGDTVIKDKLTPDMQKKLQCFESAMANASIKGKVNSAWRPEWYQQHFYEMYEKLLKLDEIDNPACNARFAEIDAHAAKHGIARFNKGGDRTPVGKPEKSNHPQGVAFDFTWRPKKSPNRVLDAKVDALASSCGLYRPYPDNDWMHFESK